VAYKTILLSRKTATPGSPASLRGGVVARASRVAGALRNQDRVPQHGARLVGRVTTSGAPYFQFPDADDPDGTLSQIYPTADDVRELARFRWTLAPGYQPRVSLIALPSGPTQYVVATWDQDVTTGQVVVEVTWTAGTSATRTVELTPPASPLEYGQVPADPWAGVVELVQTITPPAFVTPAEVAAFSSAADPVTVEVVVSAVGSPRIVDLAIFEVPVAFAQDASDSVWPFHAFANGLGSPLAKPASPYPVEAVTSSDPTQGHRQAADVADEQARSLGPILLAWTSTQNTEPVSSTSPAPWSFFGSATEWADSGDLADEALPGTSTAAGSLARQHDLSGDVLELRDEDGVIPVRVHVYAGTDLGGGTAFVRVQSGPTSWADVVVDDPTPAWFTATGELRVGVGVESDTCLRWGGEVVTCAQLDVYAVIVEHARR